MPAAPTKRLSALAQLKGRLGYDAGFTLPADVLINGDEDSTLQRFLKARQGSVDKAEEMLRASLAWRKEHDIVNIFARPLPLEKFRHLVRHFPHAHHGFDKQGQPVYIDCTGLLDADTLLEQVSKEEVLASHLVMMEFQNRVLMAEGSRLAGRTVHKMCNIVDLTGASTRLAGRKTMEVFKLIAAVDQGNYPETMGATFVVNAPWLFTAVWAVAKAFLDDGVTAKVHILGAGAPTREALLAAVDAASLPAFLGGKCVCPGGCVSGPSCTSPDGMVVSQRRILRFCSDFVATQASGQVPPEAPEAKTAVQQYSTERELLRNLAFRKPRDFVVATATDGGHSDGEVEAAAAEAVAAAHAADAAAAEAAAATQAATRARAVMALAAAEASAADAEARAAASMAHFAAEEARAAARMAAAAAAALASRLGSSLRRASQLVPPFRRRRLASDDSDGGVFEDAADSFADD